MDGFKRRPDYTQPPYDRRPSETERPPAMPVLPRPHLSNQRPQPTMVPPSQRTAPPMYAQQQPQPLPPQQLPQQQSFAQQPPAPQLPEPSHVDMSLADIPSPRRIRKTPIIISIIIGMILLGCVAAYMWYTQALQPVTTDESQSVSLEVKAGWSWPNVAEALAEKGAIKSELAFTMYARLEGVALQQATCLIRPSDSSQEIVKVLASGCKGDTYKAVMFYPGATIEKPLYKHSDAQLSQTMYVKHVLSEAGYTEAQINAALAKEYKGPLFAGKPQNATLEGYVFGDTYHLDSDATAEEVLQAAFDHMYDVIKQQNIEKGFQDYGLTLYKGITLASIVQRELNCEDKPTPERKDRCHQYQRMIAQVFHKRLKENIPLGADVTFIYAADMMKVAPSVDLDSPYNTRIHAGLPPGPIGTPGLLALKAVALPTDTDYLYFVAGDDGLIYFGRTLAEHEENIRRHCVRACQL